MPFLFAGIIVKAKPIVTVLILINEAIRNRFITTSTIHTCIDNTQQVDSHHILSAAGQFNCPRSTTLKGNMSDADNTLLGSNKTVPQRHNNLQSVM